MSQKSSLLQITHQYLKAIEQREPVEVILDYYSPDAQQIEYPNLITKKLARRTVADIKRAYESGQKVVQKQTFEVTHSFEVGNTVIIETTWTGVLAIPIGQKQIGEAMIANFCQIYQFENGKIINQRNYDCFEPF